MEEFDLNGAENISLCDLLKAKGLCQTGGHAKMVIAQGQVKVDGKVEVRKRRKIKPGQVVEFEGAKTKVIQKS